jgi:hypothetical protein
MRNCWNSKLSSVVCFLAAVCPFFSSAQFSKPEEKFPDEEKYLYPINPGTPSSLAGTMGELRSTHFHSGIDIRTGNIIGLPVLASKSGYISRVTITPSGYGNVLYVTHPDGNTTLYAHLDKFSGRIGEYVLKEQYRRKTHSIDLFFRKDQFKVKQGDTVALSGNTGSSGGPHLHFDIRDNNNYALNPLKVESFSEVVDVLPPSVEKVALRTLDKNSRINDKFGRFEFYAQKVGNDFVFTVPILASGNIGVEILAKDRLAPRSRFHGGVNYFEMQVDSQLVFSQAIDKINIAETRSIFTLMDYKTFKSKGSLFYKLYVDDGNDLEFYGKSPGNGKIKITTKEAFVKITMKDSYGNASTISLKLTPSPPTKNVKLLEPMKEEIEYDIFENILQVSAVPCLMDSNRAVVYSKGKKKTILPDYSNELRAVYLIDMRTELPDSVILCDKSVSPKLKAVVPPGREYNYFSDLLDIKFPNESIYDTVYLSVDHQLHADSSTESFTIGSKTVPLDRSLRVTYRPTNAVAWNKTKSVYRKTGKDSYAYLDSRWENGAINFATREFGEFIVLDDSIPPTIRMIAINTSVARFKIKDDLSGIAGESIEATLNGKWLLMNYDLKTNTIWAERLNKSEPLKGDFVLKVKDEAGNEATYAHKIF